ncbi:MAG: chemotaxis protein CheD [Betaproteobacteria bacterium]|nr:chemotaxis protein CheD [Betaproteobacteria bacterium]
MNLDAPVRPVAVPQTAQVFLTAGEFHFGAAPLQLATLLGSCVTVTLWHPRRLIGGMCHFLVPRRERNSDMALDGHFADEAFALFDQALLRSNSHPAEFQAKLFGGGDMFPDLRMSIDVGTLNIDAARRLLKQRGIPLLAEHAGGAGHRRLIFDLATGEVQLRFANKRKENTNGQD